MFNALVLRYSSLALPLAALGLPFYIYAPKWLAEDMGYGYATVGLLFLIARLTDIFTDIPVGIWAQPAKRQKTSQWLGAILIAFGAWMLLGTAHPMHPLILAAILVIVFLGWTMVTIPWMALPVKIARSPDERLALNTGREIFLLIATFFALIVPAMLTTGGVQIAAVAVLAMLVLTIIIQPTGNMKTAQTGVVSSLALLRNKDVRRLAAPWFLNTLANTLPGTVVILFARDILQQPEMVGYALAIYFLAAIGGAPIMYRLIKRFGARRLWMISVGWIALLYPLVATLGAGDGTLFMIISVGTGIVLSTDQVVPATMQTALAQEISTNEGGAEVNTRLFALWSLLTKAAMGIGVALGFMWLGANVEAAKPSSESIVFVYVWIPVILKLCTLPLLWRMRDFSTED